MSSTTAGRASALDAAPRGEEHLLLLGHPPAGDFFHTMRTLAADGERRSAAELVEAWRAANAHVRDLRQREAGWADDPVVAELPAEMASLPHESPQTTRAHPSEQALPGRWSWIELDRLMVFQKRINLSWVQQIDQALGAAPDARRLMSIASSEGLPRPAIHVARDDAGNYILSCRSGELRFFGTRTLDPRGTDLPMSADIAHLLGVFVGFGSNRISALLYRRRLILTNGSHRAYALRDRGFTHVPCFVTGITHEDELDLAGVREVRPQFERYLRMPRPPVFKDYFDPRLRMTVPFPRTQHALQLQVTCTTLRIPAGT